MASFSLGMLGILLMLDICFLVNYFVIRALRRWADSQTDNRSHGRNNAKRGKKDKKDHDHVTEQMKILANGSAYSELAFAWLTGSVRMEALCVRKFPAWKPLPYHLGLITTCIFVVLATIMLSPDLIAQHLGASAVQLDANLCVSEHFDAGIEAFQQELWDITNLKLAKQQHHLLQDFHQALINDTALYGIPPFQCPSNQKKKNGQPDRSNPWTKKEWEKRHKASFFPGYCEQALTAAMEAANQRVCYHEFCDCPTLPDLAVFQMAGLADKKFCGEVCISVPTACPGHSLPVVADEDRYDESNDYQLQQLLFAQQRQRELAENRTFATTLPDNIQSTAEKTAEKISHQVDIASYVYIGYSCLALFFPSPLILFRMPYWIATKRLLFGVQKTHFICFVLAVWWGVEYFRSVWYSPDLQVFLSNLRIGDPCFVDPDYLLERQNVLNAVCQELIPLEPEFNQSAITVHDVLQEVHLFSNGCNCSFPNQYLSNVTSSMVSNKTIASVLSEIGFNQTMSLDDRTVIRVPDERIQYLGNSSICTNNTAARRLVWENRRDQDAYDYDSKTDWYNLWIASGFLAMLVVKVAMANFGVSLMLLADCFCGCQGEYLWMPMSLVPEGSKAKSQTSRRAESTTTSSSASPPTQLIEKWFEKKRRALFVGALSKTFFWGLLVHLCMVNLFRSVYQEMYDSLELLGDRGNSTRDTTLQLYEMLEQRDIKVLGSCLGVAGIVIVLGIYVVHELNESAKLLSAENLPDTDDSSDSECDEDNGNRATTTREQDLLNDVVVQLDPEAYTDFPNGRSTS